MPVDNFSPVEAGTDTRSDKAAGLALAETYYRQKSFVAADTLMQQLLAAFPGDPSLLYSATLIKLALHDYRTAELYAGQLLALNDQDANVCFLAGLVNLHTRKVARAIDFFTRARMIRPGPTVNWNLAYALLLQGRFREAWPLFESRYEVLGLRRGQPGLAWQGEAMSGHTLLVLDEQGLGDSLQFLRFLPALQGAAGARLLFAGKQQVLPVVRRCFPEIEVSDWDHADLQYHKWVGLMSLPGLLGVESESSLPLPLDGEAVARNEVSKWARVLAASAPDRRPVIGLCWRGNPEYVNDSMRSPGLGVFAPLLGDARFRFISLQLGEAKREIETLGLQQQVEDFGSRIEDAGGGVLETCGLIANCDFVITSCTAVVHMLGMTRTPGAVLLNFKSDWRWMLARRDSPWYPNLVLLRQEAPWVWEQVLQQVVNLLEDRVQKV
jgi:tetratricopeptide (TPR) repeat protein